MATIQKMQQELEYWNSEAAQYADGGNLPSYHPRAMRLVEARQEIAKLEKQIAESGHRKSNITDEQVALMEYVLSDEYDDD